MFLGDFIFDSPADFAASDGRVGRRQFGKLKQGLAGIGVWGTLVTILGR